MSAYVAEYSYPSTTGLASASLAARGLGGQVGCGPAPSGAVDHAYYAINTKSYGIRGRWTCLSRRLSQTDPLERSWAVEVANANFRTITSGTNKHFDPNVDQPTVPRSSHLGEVISTEILGADGQRFEWIKDRQPGKVVCTPIIRTGLVE